MHRPRYPWLTTPVYGICCVCHLAHYVMLHHAMSEGNPLTGKTVISVVCVRVCVCVNPLTGKTVISVVCVRVCVCVCLCVCGKADVI